MWYAIVKYNLWQKIKIYLNRKFTYLVYITRYCVVKRCLTFLSNFCRFLHLKQVEAHKRKNIHKLLFWNQHSQTYIGTLPHFLPQFVTEKVSKEPHMNFTFTQFIVTLRDLFHYSSLNESLLRKLLFVVPLQLTYGFFNQTITCLTNNHDVVLSPTHHQQHDFAQSSSLNKSSIVSKL